MSDKRYEANIIRATAVEPANNLETTSAPGVWSLDEVVELQKKNKWPTAGRVSTDVDEVFSTYLYTGTGAQQTINNGLDLLNEGGVVWLKARTSATNNDHSLFDSETSTGSTFPVVQKAWESNVAGSLATRQPGFTFTSTGFTTSGRTDSNGTDESGIDYVTWSFRRAPKFFDVVNYTGDGNTSKTISHNLGVVPAMMIVLGQSTGDYWVYHKDIGNTKYLELNKTTTSQTSSTAWNNTSPTDTQFTVGNATSVNYLNSQYTVYLFAHNDGDGEFGPNGDADIIKCGSFTNSGSGVEVDLGFEPQFMMFKRTDSSGNWCVVDEMRSTPASVLAAGDNSNQLRWNLSNAENAEYNPFPTATGFKVVGAAGGGGGGSGTFVYMAIRRGPLAQPTSATEVFDVTTWTSSGEPKFQTSFASDMAMNRNVDTSYDMRIAARLTQGKFLKTSTTDAESSNANFNFDYMNGFLASGGSSSFYSWQWKRAPGYFDVVAYTGQDTAGATVSHSLGVVPEMMWVKRRDFSGNWVVYHKDMDSTNPSDYFMFLNLTDARANNTDGYWNDTEPTASVFTLGNASAVNNSSYKYIAYLFATKSGVSKVGGYTGDGTEDGSKVIDCGFSSGARFVLIKRTDSAGAWQFFDTRRGLVAGNDPRLQLESPLAQTTGYDFIDPHNSGFIVGVSTISKNAFNVSSANYIFYAIA